MCDYNLGGKMQKCWYVPSVLYLICVRDIKRIQLIYLFISRTAFHGVQGDDGVRVLLVFHAIIFYRATQLC